MNQFLDEKRDYSESSDFSMFSPNEELKGFFQREFMKNEAHPKNDAKSSVSSNFFKPTAPIYEQK